MAPQPRRVVHPAFEPSSSSSKKKKKQEAQETWLPLPSKQNELPPHIASLMDSVDGRDLEHTLRVATTILREGEWRVWMTKWFMRRHRHEVVRLMTRLTPLLPSSRLV